MNFPALLPTFHPRNRICFASVVQNVVIELIDGTPPQIRKFSDGVEEVIEFVDGTVHGSDVGNLVLGRDVILPTSPLTKTKWRALCLVVELYVELPMMKRAPGLCSNIGTLLNCVVHASCESTFTRYSASLELWPAR